MVDCRSSCLVPVSQLTPRNRATHTALMSSPSMCESFEVLISYRFDKSFTRLTPRGNNQDGIVSERVLEPGTPNNEKGITTMFISTNTESTHDTSRSHDCNNVRTPIKDASDTVIAIAEGATLTSELVSRLTNGTETCTDSVVRELRNRYDVGVELVDFDMARVQQAILSKVLADAEERNLLVTFVQDDEYAAEWPDVDLVDHEFEPIETSPLLSPGVRNSVEYILSKLQGNLFDTGDADHAPSTGTENVQLQPKTAEIEAFNHAVRFMRIKERKNQLMQHMADSEISYKRQLQSSTSGSCDHCSGRTIFKNQSDESEQPDSEHSKNIEDKIPLVVKEFSFLKRRKKLREKISPICTKASTFNNGATSIGSVVTPKLEGSANVTAFDPHKHDDTGRRRHILEDMTIGYNDIPVAIDNSRSAISDIRSHFSNSSLDRSISQPRPGSSGSLNKGSSPPPEGAPKRGILGDSRNSSDSCNGAKAFKTKTSRETRMFETTTMQCSDWSSEIWGSFINVIHSRRKTLGHGSFSTVSFAFLRLQPHVYVAKGMYNSAINGKTSKDTVCNRSNGIITSGINGRSTGDDSDTAASEPNGIIMEPRGESNQTIAEISTADSEFDVVDQMIRLIDGNCSKCANVITLDCAVKSIKDVFPHARFQYIREKEMMLHFNSNVLKPLACRIYNGEANKTYQLLMPKAQGDLYEMLKEVIKRRTRKTKAPIYITNQITGKQEQKIIGLTEREVKFLFFQILSGLAFIQMCFQANIHRHSDIKLQNILVFCKDADRYKPMRWRLCLADFGCSIMLHPTQHFEGACMFKNLQHSISKEWRGHISNQLTSFARGTVRCNAPEALSYDRNGNPRSNRNSNLLMAYKKTNLNLSCIMDDTIEQPQAWGKPSVTDSMSRLEPPALPKIPAADKDDLAEYYTVDMYSDMWSAGIILAELAKFGGVPASANEAGKDGDVKQNSLERMPMDYMCYRLNSTLGRGLFCRNTSASKNRANGDAKRNKRIVSTVTKGGSNDNQHNVEPRSVVTDENLNLMLAAEIASKCDLDTIQRLRKLKREYCWWEYPHFSSGFWALLVNLLSYKPRERYLAAEALGHPWFDDKCSNSQGIFNVIDELMAEQDAHLPMEHFYYIGSSLSLHNSSKKSQPQAECSPFTVKREDLMHLENSDLALESLGMYGKVGQTSNVWFAGPMHFRLMALNEPGISLPNFVSQICRREAVVLEAREKDIFGNRGFILSQLLDLKKRYMLKWNEMLTSRTVHLLGKNLIARDHNKM